MGPGEMNSTPRHLESFDRCATLDQPSLLVQRSQRRSAVLHLGRILFQFGRGMSQVLQFKLRWKSKPQNEMLPSSNVDLFSIVTVIGEKAS